MIRPAYRTWMDYDLTPQCELDRDSRYKGPAVIERHGQLDTIFMHSGQVKALQGS